MMPFTISTVEMSPFLSVLWLLMMLACQSTCSIIFRNVAKGVVFCSQHVWHSGALVLLLLLMLAVIPLHTCLAPNEIHFDSVICLQSHKPTHCGTLLCKVMRSSKRTMPPHDLHNQTFKSAAMYSETHSILLCHLYEKWQSLAEDGFYLWILISGTGQLNIVLWLLLCLWQINLDSATCLVLYSLFITQHTAFN